MAKDIKNHENKIILGDCLEIMKNIPDNSVDMTFADPPFNLKKKYNHYENTIEKEEYLNWCNKWMSEMVRITKPSGAIFVHNIPRWLSHFAEHLNRVAYFRHWISWDSGGAPMGKTLLPNHYGILYYTKSKSYKDFKFYDIRYPHPHCRLCREFLKDYGGKKIRRMALVRFCLMFGLIFTESATKSAGMSTLANYLCRCWKGWF